MAEYIDLEIDVDIETLQDQAIAYLEENVPGWEAAAGNLETILIEAIAAMASEQADVASRVPVAIFRFFGQDIVGITAQDGVAASAATTWSLTDDLGHTIPAGTYISIDGLVFQTRADVTIDPGDTSTGIGEVLCDAVELGEEANDLTGTPLLEDTIAWVSSISLFGTTGGGVDPESDVEFLARLVAEIQLMSPRPIIPRDFETLAKRVEGVERAVAIDLYDPGDGSLIPESYDNPRFVTIAAVDEDGEAVSEDIREDIEDLINPLRESTFEFRTTDPTYTDIDVTTDVSILPSFVEAEVQAAVEGAVALWLDPSTWGTPSSGDPRAAGGGANWVNTPTVGYLNLAAIIKGVEGVAFINSLDLDGGTADIALDGAAPLTRPGTITVTVS